MDRTEIERIVRDVLEQKSGIAAASPAIPTTARAAVLTARETLEIREFPLREIHDDEILVRVEACGVCGTDLHCYKNDPFHLIPVVLGHEGTGVVAKVGSAVKMDGVGKPVRVGDRIVTSTLDTSEACMIAKYDPSKANLCDDHRHLGLQQLGIPECLSLRPTRRAHRHPTRKTDHSPLPA